MFRLFDIIAFCCSIGKVVSTFFRAFCICGNIVDTGASLLFSPRNAAKIIATILAISSSVFTGISITPLICLLFTLTAVIFLTLPSL